jgi:hypothetical protein
VAVKKSHTSGVKQAWDEVVFKLGPAREARQTAQAVLEELVRQEKYSARKYRALSTKRDRCVAEVLRLEALEINLGQIAGVKVSKPTGRKGGDA